MSHKVNKRVRFWAVLAACVSAMPLAWAGADIGVATDQWAVRLAPGADPAAMAASMGATHYSQVGQLKDTYVFEIPNSRLEVKGGATFLRLRGDPRVNWVEQQFARQQQKRVPADPLYLSQWHLNNTGQSGGTPGQDANVVAAWNQGYTGTGVVIGVVDDGLQYTHPDLAPNYLASASWDFNYNDADPSPDVTQDFHGTSVAGVAAGRDDGATCGVGVAYRAQLSGLRLISLATTDAQEASALSYWGNTISVYSNSWGPADDGTNLAGPGTLTQAAMADAVISGRGGLGSIYVWAGGNGLRHYDNTNYDGYANSRYVIAVGASDHNGVQSYYSEPGAPLLVNAPSSGETVGITTADLLGANGYNATASPGGDCTNMFGGTSSAAPLVSGVVALMLQANPNLGWRDVRHILLGTAEKNDASNLDWVNNGAGRHVNHAYGYGRVDAGAAVTGARQRIHNLLPETTTSSGTITVNAAILDNDVTGVTSSFAVSQNFIVESVEVVFSATHTYRGDLRVALTAPSGTQSILAEDHWNANPDYSGWKFSSSRHWGELSSGTWQLNVSDRATGDTGTFDNWQLILHGRPMTFTDAGAGNTFWRGIEAIYQAGITGGCGVTGHYCPTNPVTRAQMAVFLERSNNGGNYAPAACLSNPFSDVSPQTFACNYINALKLDGITTGCGGGAYCPNNAVTRAQMAIFLLRTKHGSAYTPPACTGAMFNDVPTGSFACNWIEQLATEGITTGCGGGNYCPGQSVNRGQMAAFLTRTFGFVQP